MRACACEKRREEWRLETEIVCRPGASSAPKLFVLWVVDVLANVYESIHTFSTAHTHTRARARVQITGLVKHYNKK